jgi:hypothetical protein
MEVKNKFKATCYLRGYASWEVEVTEGYYKISDNGLSVKVFVSLGTYDKKPIVDKTYIFPAAITIIEENQ